MIYTPKDMVPGSALSATPTTYYTAPSGGSDLRAIIKEITLSNSGTQDTVALWVIPSGGAASVANKLLPDIILRAGELKYIYLSKVMSPGAFIQATGAANTSLSISGIEVTT